MRDNRLTLVALYKKWFNRNGGEGPMKTMQWPFVPAIILICIFTACVSSGGVVESLVGLDEAIEVAATEIELKTTAGAEIAVAKITAPADSIGDYLADELSGCFSRRGILVALAREADLRFADAEHQFQMSGLVSDASAVGIGHYLGAKVVISGTFDCYANFSQLRLRAVDVETSRLVASPSLRIRNNDVVLTAITAPLKDVKAPAISEQALTHLNRSADLFVTGNSNEAEEELTLAIAQDEKVTVTNVYRGLNRSGYWNELDVRIVCDTLLKQALGSPRVDSFIRNYSLGNRGAAPTVLVDRFRNDSSEYIDMSVISGIMQTAVINSSRLKVVETGGANLMLTGAIGVVVDRTGNQTVRTYFVTVSLTDIETNLVLWEGMNSEIKKVIITPKTRL
jgi:hypothetical protein